MPLRSFSNKLNVFVNSNKDFSLHCLILAISLFLTPYLLHIKPIYDFFERYQNVIIDISSKNILLLFLFDLSVGLIFISIVFVCGLSLQGFVLSFFNTFIIGIFISNFLAFNYASFGTQGFLYCLRYQIPKISIYVIAFLLSVRESFVFSKMICKSFVPGKAYNYYADFKIYCLRFVFILLIVVSSSLIFAMSVYLIK